MKMLNRISALLFFCCWVALVASAEARVMQLQAVEQGKEYRHTFLYNTSGQVQLETKYRLSGGGDWVRESQTEWYYSGLHCVKQVRRVIENDTWQNTDEIVSDYNRLDELTDEHIYRYVAGVRTPVKRTKYLFDTGVAVGCEEYVFSDGTERLAQVNAFTYNGDKVAVQVTTAYRQGTPAEVYRSVFNYTPAGDVKSQLMSRLVDGVYQNLDSITWHYDASGRLVSQRAKVWNVKNGQWDNARMSAYEYDENSQLLTETHLSWGGMAWDNVFRYEYLYEDGVQYRRSLQTQLYREWRDLMSIYYDNIIDGHACDIRSEYDFWGGDQGEAARSHIPFMFNGQWVICEAESVHLEYGDPSSVGDNADNVRSLVTVYPNPSDGVFYMNTELHEILSWSVYDMKGQLMKSKVQNFHTGVIDITELVNDVYILRVETTAGVHRQKLVKM